MPSGWAWGPGEAWSLPLEGSRAMGGLDQGDTTCLFTETPWLFGGREEGRLGARGPVERACCPRHSVGWAGSRGVGRWPVVDVKLMLMASLMDARCVWEKGVEPDPKVFGSWRAQAVVTKGQP